MKQIIPEDALKSLPSSWKVFRLKFLGQFAASGIDKKSKEGEVTVRMVNYTDVYNNETRIIDDSREYMFTTCTSKKAEEYSLRQGDLLFTPSSETIDEIGYSALVIEDLPNTVFSYHLIRFRPTVKFDLSYQKYLCHNDVVLSQFSKECKGSTRKILGRDEFGNVLIPVPSVAIQKHISTYLDHETTHIDTLIAEKKRMLALLEEKHVALISQVVTRGLNPDVPLKPSGLDWLGNIPVHWDIERAKNVFSVRDERSKTGEEELLTVSHITGVTARSEKEVYMFKADDMTGYKRCYPDDLVINTLWAWMGAMGVSPLEGIISPDYHVYKSKGLLLPEFIELLCRSKPFIAEVNRWSKGVWSSRLRLYPENFFEMRLPIPPNDEQREIVRSVKEEEIRSKELIAALNKSIDLLKERRAALITAAVTGQIPLEEVAE